MIYIILFLTFAVGFVLGGLSAFDLIKRYKKEQGYDPDLFDGKEYTRLDLLTKIQRRKRRER